MLGYLGLLDSISNLLLLLLSETTGFYLKLTTRVLLLSGTAGFYLKLTTTTTRVLLLSGTAGFYLKLGFDVKTLLASSKYCY